MYRYYLYVHMYMYTLIHMWTWTCTCTHDMYTYCKKILYSTGSITQVVVHIFEEGLNSDKQSIKTIQTLFLWVNIPPHIKFH